MQIGFLLESVKQRYLLEGLVADGRVILNCILSTWWEGVTGLILVRKGQMQGCCKHSCDPAVSVNSGEILRA
jgi:hypothetical protein